MVKSCQIPPASFNRASIAEIQGCSGPEIIIDIILCSLFPEGWTLMKWDVSTFTEFVKAPVSPGSLEVNQRAVIWAEAE